MKMEKLGRFKVVRFDCLSELVEYANANPDNYYSKTYPRRPGFCNVTFAETVQAASEGWPDGTREIDIAVDMIGTRISDADAYHINHDVSGEYIDMGRFVTGEPECFGHMTLEPLPTETISIDVNISAHCGINDQTIINRGAALSAMLDRLTRNYFVKLRFYWGVERITGGHNFVVFFNVDTRNSFSRDLLSFCCAHPGLMRRIMFGVAERLTHQENLGGYGYPTDAPDSLLFPMNFKQINDNSEFGTIESATAAVQKYLEQAKLTAARE